MNVRSTVAALAAFALMLGACSSDNATDDPDPAQPAAGTANEETSSEEELSGDPVRIGWANLDTGTPSFPAITDGALSAVEYINEELGGVDGHPVELVTCSVTADNESHQQCGQQFANDDSIAIAATGILLNGGAFYSPLEASGKPVLGGAPVTPADYAAPDNTQFYVGGGAALYVGLAQLAQEVFDAQSVGILYADNAGGESGLADFKRELEGSGIEISEAPIADGASDVLPQVTAVNPGDTDLTVVATNGCIPVAQALDSVAPDANVAAISSCLSASNVQEQPQLFEGWYLGAYGRIPQEGEGIDQDTDTFLTAYPKYAELETDPLGTYAEKGWGHILTVYDILVEAGFDGATSAETMLEAARDFSGPVVLGPDSVDCPGDEPYPAVCSLEVIPYQVQDGGFVPQ